MYLVPESYVEYTTDVDTSVLKEARNRSDCPSAASCSAAAFLHRRPIGVGTFEDRTGTL